MASSTSRLSYADCYELYDKALASANGIRFPVVDKGAANQFRVRLHTARGLHRDDNRASYESNHPLYGRSEYDALSVQVRRIDGKWYIRIVKISAPGEIEELTEDEVNGTSQSATSDHGSAEGESDNQAAGDAVEREINYATVKVDRRF